MGGSIHSSSEGFVSIDDEKYYKISAIDRMSPFLMNIASDTDLWMFISSTGGLTAGRIDADGALFPYETVDKLHDAHSHTGPITLIRCSLEDGEEVLWEPFSSGSMEHFNIERNLYKNITCNRVIFEENNYDLGLSFRYRWTGSEMFGHVRTAELKNFGSETLSLSLIDGLRNILPFGAPLVLYQQSSTLVDAYKRVDCDRESRLGIYSLTSRITDRAEAAEELRANTVWCNASIDFSVGLSIESVNAFRESRPVKPQTILTGRRGNYLITMRFDLEPGKQEKWHVIADSGKNHVEISALRNRILEQNDLGKLIETSLVEATENLRNNVGCADGLQLTGHEEASAHHFSNVLFNNMRGGVFAKNYEIETADFREFIGIRNRDVLKQNYEVIASLPDRITAEELYRVATDANDPHLERLCYEYLPIYFGRRHGDPSRPWNRFSIKVKNREGGRLLRHEGNWRDIFQNWEGLGISFPGFLPCFISKFVNASTVDGFNPYRITNEGIDWEVAEKSDPWSNIGYWGDHQIIYLLKFLESLIRFYPGKLEEMMIREIFSYSDVPYRIRPYETILKDSKSTIDYDFEQAAEIAKRVKTKGTDGRLVHGHDGRVYHVSLFEKLLVPLLSKVSNLVPDGGIWMNTQRPEWNDANNALVGNGISMVTLCYLRRYLAFMVNVLEDMDDIGVQVSNEIVNLFDTVHSILEEECTLLRASTIENSERKRMLDRLGGAFSDYRDKAYSQGFKGKREIRVRRAVEFYRIVLRWLDHAISVNWRKDGLFNSYNILEISRNGKEAIVQPLYEMLEGQVAVLSSGVVTPEEALKLLSALYESKMYREDQRSFMLYPERKLPTFMSKNAVTAEQALSIPLIQELIEAGDGSIITCDADNIYRFNPDFANAADLIDTLDKLAEDEEWASRVAQDRQAVLGLFEFEFKHKSFTGRSGTMYGYEGLGCIYWHMVSKLLLAVQEITFLADNDSEWTGYRNDLADYYYKIRAGLSFEKTVREYGAFPTDPYSHTPPHAGAKQPGMTGQVKEEILTRFGELGVRVEDGAISFQPILLSRTEFLSEEGMFRYFDIEGESRLIKVPAGSLAFTFCQIPVIYEIISSDPWIRVGMVDGNTSVVDGCGLEVDISRSLFERLGVISRIDVGIPVDVLL
jgi:hypothetical protein